MSALTAQIEAWYQKYQPKAYEGIKDKPAFFQELTDRATEQIEQLTEALTGPDQPGESYVHKLGRLNQAQAAATEQVMRDFAMSPPPPNWKDSPAPSPQTPDPSMLPDPDLSWENAMEAFATASSELDDQRRSARLKALPTLPKRPTSTPEPPVSTQALPTRR